SAQAGDRGRAGLLCVGTTEHLSRVVVEVAKALGLDPIREDGKDEMPWQMIGDRLLKDSLPAGSKRFEVEIAQMRDLALDRGDGGLASVRLHGITRPDPRQVHLCLP